MGRVVEGVKGGEGAYPGEEQQPQVGSLNPVVEGEDVDCLGE